MLFVTMFSLYSGFWGNYSVGMGQSVCGLTILVILPAGVYADCRICRAFVKNIRAHGEPRDSLSILRGNLSIVGSNLSILQSSLSIIWVIAFPDYVAIS